MWSVHLAYLSWDQPHLSGSLVVVPTTVDRAALSLIKSPHPHPFPQREKERTCGSPLPTRRNTHSLARSCLLSARRPPRPPQLCPLHCLLPPLPTLLRSKNPASWALKVTKASHPITHTQVALSLATSPHTSPLGHHLGLSRSE